MPITINKYSRAEIINTVFNDSTVDNYKNDYFICVNATGDMYAIPHFKLPHNNVLNIAFDDTDVDQYKSCPKGDEEHIYFSKACTVDQAIEIKKFIDNIPDNSNIHVYCAKGRSRSTAIANFIEEYRNKGDKIYEFYNQYLYNLLLKVKNV